MIVGVDEAGRGPLAGVVTACALCFLKQPPFSVRDSKELSAARREEMFPWLIDNTLACVGIASPEEIDKYNILEATMRAANRAIEGLLAKSPKLARARFIIDGNIFRTHLDIDYECIEKADKTVKEVSCASIVAKVTRDHLMGIADFLYPEWSFRKHKGYPTKEHFSLIKQYPVSPLHRKSFFPCSRQK